MNTIYANGVYNLRLTAGQFELMPLALEALLLELHRQLMFLTEDFSLEADNDRTQLLTQIDLVLVMQADLANTVDQL